MSILFFLGGRGHQAVKAICKITFACVCVGRTIHSSRHQCHTCGSLAGLSSLAQLCPPTGPGSRGGACALPLAPMVTDCRLEGLAPRSPSRAGILPGQAGTGPAEKHCHSPADLGVLGAAGEPGTGPTRSSQATGRWCQALCSCDQPGPPQGLCCTPVARTHRCWGWVGRLQAPGAPGCAHVRGGTACPHDSFPTGLSTPGCLSQ